MYEIHNFKPRLYQQTIMHSAMKGNSMIVLPTGLGKTKTAILIAIQRLNTHPNSKVLFLTPTKPLAAQIQKEFQECTSIDDDKILLFTGAVSPAKRAKQWKEAEVVISTPQGMTNDIINRKVDIKNLSCIFFDEAHHATGDYDYVFIAKQYFANAHFPRIVGLSASPGSDMTKIQEVCKNLKIEEIEVRTQEDPDVKPYIQELEMEYINLELPEEMKEVKKDLDECFKSKLIKIKEMGYINSVNYTTKKELLGLQRELQKRIARGEKDYGIWTAISTLAEAIKVGHASELLETQDTMPLMCYLHKLMEEGEKSKTKASKNLIQDPNFKSAFLKVLELEEKEINHPKIEKLKQIIQDDLSAKKDSKFIVFNQFRDSSVKIAQELNKLEGVNAEIFVGQTKKSGTGLTQKEQINLIERFRNNEFNCCVCTAVGEEGLDIPSVDQVIFYEPIPSAVRSIQRRGRTARLEKGKVTMLITKNTRDEAYRWTAHHKERKMYDALKNLKNKIKLESQPKLTDFKPKEELKIMADQREKGSGIMKDLVEKGVKVDMQTLDVGDFAVSSRIGIERKEVKDFVGSLVDGRLIPQLKALRDNFERPLLIIEGTDDIYSIRRVHPNAIRGMISMIAVSFGIPMIYTKDAKDTAEFLITLAKREQQGTKEDFGVRLERKPLTTREQQEFIIESLPGVGPTLAKSLLKEFSSVKGIMNAEEEKLMKVAKIGEKKAEEIIRILHEEYEE